MTPGSHSIFYLFPKVSQEQLMRHRQVETKKKIQLGKCQNPKKKAKASPKAKAKCPEELKSFEQFDKSGSPICWAFNLGGCKDSVSNGRCKKGVHICMKCNRSNHGLATCRVNKN